MRLFQGEYRGRDGQTNTCRRWTCEFRDHLGRVRRWALWEDKPTSKATMAKLKRLVATRRAGEPVPADLATWIPGLPQSLREKMARTGLIDGHHVAAAAPLAQHLDAFEAWLKGQPKVSQSQAHGVARRARRVLLTGDVRDTGDGYEGFTRWSDITAERVNDVQRYLKCLRNTTAGKGKTGKWLKPYSANTVNKMRGSSKRFGQWMVDHKGATASPLEALKGFDRSQVEADRDRGGTRRRALTIPETKRLIATTAAGPEHHGMTGRERAALYRLAVETGLRQGEIRSLTLASFELDAAPPVVRVLAANTKNGKEAEQPLPAATAAALKVYLAERRVAADGDVPAFTLPIRERVATMLREDLAAADIPFRDDAGRKVDFHALRGTYVTNLARGGVHPRVAQELARHSTIDLTMSHYTFVALEDRMAAVAALPDLDATDETAAEHAG